MKFKKGVKIETDGFIEDLMNGYIEAQDILELEEDVKRINDAIDLLQQFEAECEDKGIIEEN